MSAFENNAIYGGTGNTSGLPDNRYTLTGGGYDYGAILTDGILGRINQEAQRMIGGAVNSGQLVPSVGNPALTGFKGVDQTTLLMIAGVGLVGYLLAKA